MRTPNKITIILKLFFLRRVPRALLKVNRPPLIEFTWIARLHAGCIQKNAAGA